jgi:cytochrome P450
LDNGVYAQFHNSIIEDIKENNHMIDHQLSDIATIAGLPTPPKTRGLPLLGSLPALVKRPFDFLLAARARYGDIYTLDLGLFKLVMANHPRQIEHVLVNHSRNYVRSGATYDAARIFMGNGLAMSDGEFWLRQRRMMQPHFHRKRLAALTELMVTTIDQGLASWATAGRVGRASNLHPAFNRITMNVIVRALFGTALSHHEVDELSTEMAFAVDNILPSAIASSLPSWLPIPGARRFRRVRQKVDTALYEVIKRVRQGGGTETLMAMMLDMVDAETGAQMTDQQLRDEAVNLVFAGYETTSLTLSWTCDLLTRHPEVMAKLQAEVDTVLGGRTPTFADLPSLAYTNMVLQETMRLRPPAWFLSRSAVEADAIDRYAIPAGAFVAMPLYVIHRHPDYWEDPERFDPERFTPERVAGHHKFAWMAFGAGQHQCIGRDFALMEAQLLLAMLVQRYRITAAGHTATPKLTATLQPKDGVWVTLQKAPEANGL